MIPDRTSPRPQAPDVDREHLLRSEIAFLREELARLRQEKTAWQAAQARGSSSPLPHPRPGAPRNPDLELAARDALLQQIHASSSWRLTRPLRVIARLLRGLRAAGQARIEALQPARPASPASGAAAGPIPPALTEPELPCQLLVAGPWPEEAGRRSRLDAILAATGASGGSVTWALAGGEPGRRPPWAEGARLLPDAAALDAHVATRGAGLRWAVLPGTPIAEALLPVLRARCPWARVVFDARDEEAATPGAAMRAASRGADLTLVTGLAAKEAILRAEPEAVVEVLPEPVPLRPAPPPAGAAARVIVLAAPGPGEAGHRVTAHLLDAAWPGLRASRPDLVLRLVSDGPVAQGVAVEAADPRGDPALLLRDAALCVVPLPAGPAARRLIGSALGQGVPVVATQEAALDLGLHPGDEVLTAETGAAFAEQVAQLAGDTASRQRLAEAGHAFATAQLSGQAVRERAAELLHG